MTNNNSPAFMIRPNKEGRTWAAVIVRKGDRTGREGCLIHKDDKPVVRFFDLTHAHERISQDLPNDVHVFGQFVSSYFLDTLLGRDGYGGRCGPEGLNLQGGVPAWRIDGETMQDFMKFIEIEADK